MKNYHALGIIIAATVIFVSACSMAIAAEPVKAECPMPDGVNTGWVIVDTDGDGEPDRMFQIYNQGACVGQLVNPDDEGQPYEAQTRS